MSSVLPPPLPPELSGAHASGLKLEAAAGLSRRTLFKLFGVGGVLLAGGGWVYGTFLHMGPPAKGAVLLNDDELLISGKIAETFFPGPPHVPLSSEEVGLAAFSDAYIAGLYEDQQRLLRILLRTLNVSTVFAHGRTFATLDLAARREVLGDWQRSRVMVKRASYQSLRFMFAMGYFEEPKVRRALGIRHGCDLSGRLPELTSDGVKG